MKLRKKRIYTNNSWIDNMANEIKSRMHKLNEYLNIESLLKRNQIHYQVSKSNFDSHA